MLKATLLSLTCLALTSCTTTGPNPNTDLRTIGPDVKKAGVFTGKEGAISGTVKAKGLMPAPEDDDTEAMREMQKPAAAQPTGSISVDEAEYAEFQAWKARQSDEFEAWKQAREREEYEAWKSSQKTQ